MSGLSAYDVTLTLNHRYEIYDQLNIVRSLARTLRVNCQFVRSIFSNGFEFLGNFFAASVCDPTFPTGHRTAPNAANDYLFTLGTGRTFDLSSLREIESALIAVPSAENGAYAKV